MYITLASRYSLDTIECFKQVSSLQLSKTPLRKSCEESFVRKCSLNDINAKYSKIDGSCNYKSNGNRGKSFTSYKRLLVPNYLDGVQRIRRSVTKDSLPSARLISNKLNKNEGATNENLTLSLVQWTEFIGNDMAHTATNKMRKSTLKAYVMLAVFTLVVLGSSHGIVDRVLRILRPQTGPALPAPVLRTHRNSGR